MQYVGVSGVTSAAQVNLLHDVWRANRWGQETPVVRAACYMSYQSLNSIPHTWRYDYPDKTRIQKIFRSSVGQSCLHYVDQANIDVARSLVRAIVHGGPYLQALHLDMVWPSPNMLAQAFGAIGRQPLVTLRVGREALAACDDDARTVVGYLVGYEGLITHVSLDRSLGADVLVPYIDAIHVRFPELGIELAGGLGAKTVHLVRDLLQRYSFLSIMAGTSLRLRNDPHVPMQWDEAAEYLRRMMLQMRTAEQPL